MDLTTGSEPTLQGLLSGHPSPASRENVAEKQCSPRNHGRARWAGPAREHPPAWLSWETDCGHSSCGPEACPLPGTGPRHYPVHIRSPGGPRPRLPDHVALPHSPIDRIAQTECSLASYIWISDRQYIFFSTNTSHAVLGLTTKNPFVVYLKFCVTGCPFYLLNLAPLTQGQGGASSDVRLCAFNLKGQHSLKGI